MLNAINNSFTTEYSTANQFGSITESHRIAIDQIKRTYVGNRPHYKVLDLGLRDGAFLKKLQDVLPEAEYTGINLSSEMLERARNMLPVTTIEASAAEITNYLPPHSQDLVLAHFLNASIPIDTLLSAAKSLTRSTGYFSFVTTTYESFPVAQQYLADFITQGSLLGSIIGHYYKSIVKNATVAASEEELLKAFEQHEFEVIEHHRLRIPMVLNNIEELALFGIEGTWFLNNISIRMLPKQFLIDRLKRLFDKVFTFPYQDIHIIDIILAKK